MRDQRKKPDPEEMLIVHRPALHPDPDKAGRGPAANTELEREELGQLTRRLAAERDPEEKQKLMARIQGRFGNEKAAQVVRELREQAGDDDSQPRPPARPKRGKA